MRMRLYFRYVPPCSRGVDAEGNFYTDPGSADEAGRLNLDALPQNMPLVECGPACPCGSACANRVTQRGLKYVQQEVGLMIGSRYTSNPAMRSVWGHSTMIPRHSRRGHSYASTQANTYPPRKPIPGGPPRIGRKGREIISSLSAYLGRRFILIRDIKGMWGGSLIILAIQPVWCRW
jgi:hypothetical protein